MWRYLIGALGALALATAGLLLFRGDARPGSVLPLVPPPPRTAGSAASEPLPAQAPTATERTREQKRFDRYDKDRDGKVTRDEYLAARRKAFAKLDTNHDGQLSFDEWAVKAEAKFAAADADRSGAMTQAEFATTAVKRKVHARPRCAPADGSAAATNEDG